MNEMKKCLVTTAGCGEDYSKCTLYNSGEGLSTASQTQVAVSPNSNVKVAQGTLQVISSKRNMCEAGVVKFCVAVKDKVWPAVLDDIAPALRAAELIAQSDLRMSKLSTVADCFEKACKSQFGEKDAASYDACLTNPANVAEMCKVEMDRTGVKPNDSDPIWKYVKAKLAALRVDACSMAIKKYLESDLVCGPSYTGCIGADLLLIQDLVPPDALVACGQNGESVTKADWAPEGKIGGLVTALMLNLDNQALELCNKAKDEAMQNVCGDETCSNFSEDFGIRNLKSMETGNGDAYEITGLIDFTKFSVKPVNEAEAASVANGAVPGNVYPSVGYSGTTKTPAEEAFIADIESKILQLKGDTKVKWCAEGRDLSQIMSRSASGSKEGRTKTEARFPRYLDSDIETLINSSLLAAQKNYDKKLPKLISSAQDALKAKASAGLVGVIDGNICWMPSESAAPATAAAQ